MIPSGYLAARLIVTFLVIGFLITIIAIAAEKRGGKLGGFLVGIPSTSALSFFFLGCYISPNAAANAADAFPVFMALTGLFLLLFGYTARKSFMIGMIVSILVWFSGSLLLIIIGQPDFGFSFVACGIISAIVYCLFRFWLKPESPRPIKSTYKWSNLLLRFVFGGGIVTMSVFMGQLGIPMLSGMFAAFPALTISTLIIITINGGSEGTKRATGMTMSMMVPMMLMCIPYSMAVHYLYPMVGVIYGTLAAFAIVTVIGVPYYFFAKDMLVPTFDV